MSDPSPGSRSAPGPIPFSAIVGQEEMKLALQIAYVQPATSGVLLAGERGTAKSTIVRAFARAVYGPDRPLVVLPINATEDRVVGGWDIARLVGQSDPVEKPGLLEEADGRILYIDEVNLLDDHIVNIILDVAASNELVVQYEGLHRTVPVRFAMVGTMNPEEGTLRPQLLDRFDLFVQVRAETDQRAAILTRMLALDAAMHSDDDTGGAPLLTGLRAADHALRERLDEARQRCHRVSVDAAVIDACVALADRLQADGHRGECVLARSCQALAAIEGAERVGKTQLQRLAKLAFQHRSRAVDRTLGWTREHDQAVQSVLDPLDQ